MRKANRKAAELEAREARIARAVYFCLWRLTLPLAAIVLFLLLFMLAK